jgi:hypothetical protein
MPICKHHHLVGVKKETAREVPHYYIAGICIVDPIHEGGLTSFLKSRYPYCHSKYYEESKKEHPNLVPDNIVAANFNL